MYIVVCVCVCVGRRGGCIIIFIYIVYHYEGGGVLDCASFAAASAAS